MFWDFQRKRKKKIQGEKKKKIDREREREREEERENGIINEYEIYKEFGNIILNLAKF